MASDASNDGFLRTKTPQEEEKDKELESLVSYLLGDEDAFQDLQNLTVPLPSSPLSTDWDPMELLSESNLDEGAGPLMVEEMLTSEDLNVQPLLSDRIHSSETFGKSTNSGSGNINPGSENINPGSGNEILSLNFNPTSCASVLHDHTYSKKTVPKSSMLSFVGVELPPDVSIADDTEESNGSDAGYDTMSSSSPGSKFDPLSTPPTSSPSPPLALQATPIIDPVKLIDERIKYFMSKQQEVNLTEEEKETLRAEGLPIPTTLPLTKTEEKALKTVRRKIRNKAAAQESRNKKKKYMESLEERLKSCTHSNKKLMKKVETLETENHSLRQQLAHLQALVVRATNPATLGGRPVQFGSCLMVIVLCFGILFGNLLPYKVSIATDMSSSTTATVRSRSLLSVDSAQNTWSYYWEYFYSSLLPGQLAPPTKTSVPHRAHVNYLFEAFYYDNETTPTSSRI